MDRRRRPDHLPGPQRHRRHPLEAVKKRHEGACRQQAGQERREPRPVRLPLGVEPDDGQPAPRAPHHRCHHSTDDQGGDEPQPRGVGHPLPVAPPKAFGDADARGTPQTDVDHEHRSHHLDRQAPQRPGIDADERRDHVGEIEASPFRDVGQPRPQADAVLPGELPRGRSSPPHQRRGRLGDDDEPGQRHPVP